MRTLGIFSQYEFYNAVEDLLQLSIDDAIHSHNPIIRGLAIMDYRFGKRRIKLIEDENIIVNKLLRIRLNTEGLFKEDGNFT